MESLRWFDVSSWAGAAWGTCGAAHGHRAGSSIAVFPPKRDPPVVSVRKGGKTGKGQKKTSKGQKNQKRLGKTGESLGNQMDRETWDNQNKPESQRGPEG